MDPMEPQLLQLLQQQQEQIAQMAAQIQLLQQQPMAAEPVAVPVNVPENGDDIDAKRLRQFLKLNPKKFSAEDKTDPEDWVYQIEVLLQAAQITEEASKLKVIPHVLEKAALVWWRFRAEDAGAKAVTNFREFKEELISQYRQQDPARIARGKLKQLRQTGAASTYADQFSKLNLRAKVPDGEKQYWFMEGLKQDLRTKVEVKHTMKEFENYEHLVRYTIAEDNAMFLAGRSNGKRKNGNKWYGGQASSSGNGNGHASHSNDSAPMEVDTYEHIPKMTPAIKKWLSEEDEVEIEETSLPVEREELDRDLKPVDLDLGPLVATWKDTKSANLLVTKGRVGCAVANTLFDTGASVTIASGRFVEKHKFKTRTIEHGPIFRTADGCKHRCEKIMDTARFTAGPYKDTLTNVYVIPGDCPFDLILGKPWFDEKNPEIDFPNNIIKMQHNGETIVFRADYHEQKVLRDAGIISSVEMYAELASGGYINICMMKPVPDDYENYEFDENGHKLDKTGYEKYADEILREFVDVTDPDIPYPVDREVEHEIELEPDAKAVAQQMYRLTFEELAELKKTIIDYLNKGFIRPSKSPFGAPILFVRKKGGALRMCVDYRGLNRITKKNRCPLPRIEDLLDQLAGAKFFTSLDLTSGYHQIKIKEEDIEKTAFRTQFGHFEFLVMPFGLCNAPATFQTLMNTVFREEINHFVLVYLDDIMIFSKTFEDHLRHITTILEWPEPKNTTDILSFLGFTGWYRKFIEKYSHVAAPMTELLKKEVPFIWGAPQQEAFELLKKKLTNAPVLILPSPDFPFHMYTDASDFAFGGVLMQDQGQGLRPVAYSSKKLSEAERKYTIYEKEALSQIHHLQLWRCYLQGAPRSTAYTDNAVLKNLQTQPRLSPRQARWMLVLQEYNLYVEYIAGKANVVADALSRRPDLAMTVVIAHQDSEWLLELKESYEKNDDAKKIIKLIQNGTSRNYAFDHGYIVRRTPTRTQLYIPDVGTLRHDLLIEHHDSLLAGHFGAAKTGALLSRHYYWPQQLRDVREFVQACQECGNSKSSNQKKPGLLKSLPIPKRRFEVITMDFVTKLPEADGFTAIMIMVDKLTKRVFLAPTTDAVTAEEAATMFFEHVIRNQGVPSIIISDRGTQFKSVFWKSMVAQLGIKHKLSTAYHPQTDGQSEITVRIVIDLLRTLHYQYKNWVKILPAVEFAINNSVNASTGKTPFFLCYGEEVPTPASINLQFLARNNPNQPSVDFAERTQVAVQQAQRALVKAQQRQKTYADKNRRYLTFEVGDQVYISTTDLPLKGPRRLAPKWFGPVPIIEKLSDLNYRVALPEMWKRRHPVFHIEKLKPFVVSTKFPSRSDRRPPPDLEQGSDVYNVEKILNRRSTRRGRGWRIEYYIKWEGYPMCDSTWEPKTNLQDAGTKVQRMMQEVDLQHNT
ncbi:hypothetical protein KSW81_007282 [Nannochloris sp. 'desiccata']|nr:hypothetical protein KSW81_007282 [Chlorella desiccata (nom. nud.)]